MQAKSVDEVASWADHALRASADSAALQAKHTKRDSPGGIRLPDRVLSSVIKNDQAKTLAAQTGDANDHRERQMSYLINEANERPMLRTAASVILAFCCAAPFVLLFSSLVVYGLRSFIQ